MVVDTRDKQRQAETWHGLASFRKAWHPELAEHFSKHSAYQGLSNHREKGDTGRSPTPSFEANVII